MAVRVLVVDDSAFMRKVIAEMVASDTTFEVVGTARDGVDALDRIKTLKPDLMTLDVEMPNLDGLGVLRALRATPKAQRPKIVMCSSLTREGSVAALTALELGASDFVAKDASIALTGLDALKRELLERLRALAPRVPVQPAAPAPRPVPTGQAPVIPARPQVLAIGCSTGGPPVLERLVHRLPKDITCPVVVAQHMPALFTRSLSDRLHQLGPLRVLHAETGDYQLERGGVWIIQGAMNGHVRRAAGGTLSLRVEKEPADAPYKPSVNVLMHTAGETCGSGAVGVVLTGMGDDGLLGGRVLVARGGVMVSQNEASSVVYGMPRAVAEAGLSSTQTPDEMSRWLMGLSGSALRHAG
jgi:two-component system, chemotaxis family, protein-glutamate methylesterase/glutaminase